jgi:hypothetical protein
MPFIQNAKAHEINCRDRRCFNDLYQKLCVNIYDQYHEQAYQQLMTVPGATAEEAKKAIKDNAEYMVWMFRPANFPRLVQGQKIKDALEEFLGDARVSKKLSIRFCKN